MDSSVSHHTHHIFREQRGRAPLRAKLASRAAKAAFSTAAATVAIASSSLRQWQECRHARRWVGGAITSAADGGGAVVQSGSTCDGPFAGRGSLLHLRFSSERNNILRRETTRASAAFRPPTLPRDRVTAPLLSRLFAARTTDRRGVCAASQRAEQVARWLPGSAANVVN